MEQVIGISESKIENTINYMSNIETRIGTSLDSVSELIKNSSSYFKCSATSEMNRILNDIEGNIPTIKQNISMYPKDMKIVKERFGEVEITSKNDIQEAIENMVKYEPYKNKGRD